MDCIHLAPGILLTTSFVSHGIYIGEKILSLSLRRGHTEIVWKIICYPRKEETTKWKKLHNTERHDLHSLPNSATVTKCRWIGRMGYVAQIELRNARKFWAENPEGK